MKISKINFEVVYAASASIDKQGVHDQASDEEGEGERVLCCPECEKVWFRTKGVDSCFEGKCEHLRFVWEGNAEVECHNGFLVEHLVVAAKSAYKSINSADYLGAESDLLREIQFDENIWEKIELDQVDGILNHTQEFMTCGPSTHTVLFGIKRQQA